MLNIFQLYPKVSPHYEVCYITAQLISNPFIFQLFYASLLWWPPWHPHAWKTRSSVPPSASASMHSFPGHPLLRTFSYSRNSSLGSALTSPVDLESQLQKLLLSSTSKPDDFSPQKYKPAKNNHEGSPFLSSSFPQTGGKFWQAKPFSNLLNEWVKSLVGLFTGAFTYILLGTIFVRSHTDCVTITCTRKADLEH